MPDWSSDELIAAVLARHLRDREVAIMGVSSTVPQAACRLASALHAPGLSYITGGTGAVNPRHPELVLSCGDERLLGAVAIPLPEVILLEGRGDVIDVFFAGGLQVDVHGNCNLALVGPHDRPRLRGPGTVGLSFLPRAVRVMVYVQSHTPRTFVERVDFLSGPGYLAGPAEWRTAGVPGRGPALVVTPLCVFDFSPDTLRMRVSSLHPGVTAEQVRDATGFPVELRAAIDQTPAPTAEELSLLRGFDPAGLLRGGAGAA